MSKQLGYEKMSSTHMQHIVIPFMLSVRNNNFIQAILDAKIDSTLLIKFKLNQGKIQKRCDF